MYSKMLSLRFPRKTANKPVVFNLAKKFDLTFNILKAAINPREEGFMVLELSGHRTNFQEGIRYLKSLGIHVESIGQDMRRDKAKCFQCGACTAVCPTGALFIKRPEMEVVFDRDRCSACELCIPACPARAMAVRFNRALLY